MPAVMNREFFEVAAQVIPVLLLIALVDYSGEPDLVDEDAPRHRLGGPERRLALVRLGTLASLVWAEIAALVAVAGRPTRFEGQLVVFGLALGAFGVIDRVVLREIDRYAPTMRPRARVATTVGVISAVVAPIVVAAIVTVLP